MKTLTVNDLNPGDIGIVRKYHGSGEVKRHLRELGLVNGTKIKVERRAPLGYPIEVKIQGFNLALRKEEAELIELETNSK
ncbi:MAG: FeoA family protein [Methanobacteriaceae archaeon]|nr:FeoA family protein [Methanobacteriaceae archaeon]